MTSLYSRYVGSITAHEFMMMYARSASVEEAVDKFILSDWRWDEEATIEIRQGLIEAISQLINEEEA